MEEKHFIIPESLINGLLEYLMERPYKEVAGGVQGLQNLQELKQENKDK
jgi:hypothetical protein